MAKNKTRFGAASEGFNYKEPMLTAAQENEKKSSETEADSLSSKEKPQTVEKKKASPKRAEKNTSADPVNNPKVGRPKGVPKTRVTVYLPNEMLEQISGAMNMYKGDMASYIGNLINKDIEKNGALYKQISELAGK